MAFSIGVVGVGQFGAQFAHLFHLHPGVSDVFVVDERPERADEAIERYGLTGSIGTFEELLASDVDAVAIFTQRWTHGPLVEQALRAGKHVYSAVPMAVTEDEIARIIDAVREARKVYMMGETSYYNPATVYARQQHEAGRFGRVFYSEGDYVHDMDLGFYDAYQYSGGENWKRTASYPPMLYPTHSVGGVLGATGSHAVSVSCVGYRDEGGDGVFDREISMFANDFSNASALFELAAGGSMRINEFRRVGYPSHLRESRFRYFGTEASFEQLALVSVWQDKHAVADISDQLETQATMDADDPMLADVAPALRDAFISGMASVHDAGRLPAEFRGLPNGHEGSHHFLVDDFVTAINTGTLPPVNAWEAARYTLPGIVAHQSALRGGERLPVPDFGDAPAELPRPVVRESAK